MKALIFFKWILGEPVPWPTTQQIEEAREESTERLMRFTRRAKVSAKAEENGEEASDSGDSSSGGESGSGEEDSEEEEASEMEEVEEVPQVDGGVGEPVVLSAEAKEYLVNTYSKALANKGKPADFVAIDLAWQALKTCAKAKGLLGDDVSTDQIKAFVVAQVAMRTKGEGQVKKRKREEVEPMGGMAPMGGETPMGGEAPCEAALGIRVRSKITPDVERWIVENNLAMGARGGDKRPLNPIFFRDLKERGLQEGRISTHTCTPDGMRQVVRDYFDDLNALNKACYQQ